MPPANDTGGAATVEDDPGVTEPGGDAQIAAVTRGFEIRDRRAAAAAVHPGLGLGVEAPVHAGVEHGLGIPDGNVDPRIGVAWPGLEQQYRMATAGGEAVGKNAAGGAGADDDVISRERGRGSACRKK